MPSESTRPVVWLVKYHALDRSNHAVVGEAAQLVRERQASIEDKDRQNARWQLRKPGTSPCTGNGLRRLPRPIETWHIVSLTRVLHASLKRDHISVQTRSNPRRRPESLKL